MHLGDALSANRSVRHKQDRLWEMNFAKVIWNLLPLVRVNHRIHHHKWRSHHHWHSHLHHASRLSCLGLKRLRSGRRGSSLRLIFYWSFILRFLRLIWLILVDTLCRIGHWSSGHLLHRRIHSHHHLVLLRDLLGIHHHRRLSLLRKLVWHSHLLSHQHLLHLSWVLIHFLNSLRPYHLYQL